MRELPTASTGSNPSLPDVAPSPPPPDFGEKGFPHVALDDPECETLSIRGVGCSGIWEDSVYCLGSSRMALDVPVCDDPVCACKT
ncbi:hypothetical protein L3X38_033648 [Prunus dulcis]|uniref:Uncharacterized protein n=1 Tax=Prunus dulcis TaxID=3755 RepID=A0AAD4VGC9_PRUDU|nr:hypothetical protein L3X38_033648 [Prunus dulcis]